MNPLDHELVMRASAAWLSIEARQHLLTALRCLRAAAEKADPSLTRLGPLVVAAWDHALREASRIHEDSFASESSYQAAQQLVESVYESMRSEDIN